MHSNVFGLCPCLSFVQHILNIARSEYSESDLNSGMQAAAIKYGDMKHKTCTINELCNYAA